jgi:membrane protein YqaA with SNARE-associated domain
MSIITEAFVARLLPVFHEVTLPAILNLHPTEYPLAAAVAGVGGVAAAALLYLLGVWLRRMPERVSSDSQRARIEKMRAKAHEWLPWLLILAPTPIGGMLVVASGFFAIRPLVAAIAIIAAEVLWRASPVM